MQINFAFTQLHFFFVNNNMQRNSIFFYILLFIFHETSLERCGCWGSRRYRVSLAVEDKSRVAARTFSFGSGSCLSSCEIWDRWRIQQGTRPRTQSRIRVVIARRPCATTRHQTNGQRIVRHPRIRGNVYSSLRERKKERRRKRKRQRKRVRKGEKEGAICYEGTGVGLFSSVSIFVSISSPSHFSRVCRRCLQTRFLIWSLCSPSSCSSFHSSFLLSPCSASFS